MCIVTVYRVYCTDCGRFMGEHSGREHCQHLRYYGRDQYGRCRMGETIREFQNRGLCFDCKRKRDEREESWGHRKRHRFFRHHGSWLIAHLCSVCHILPGTHQGLLPIPAPQIQEHEPFCLTRNPFNRMCRTTIYDIYCIDCNKFMREHKSREYCDKVDEYYATGYRSMLGLTTGLESNSSSWPDGYGMCATGETFNTFTYAHTQRCFTCKVERHEEREDSGKSPEERTMGDQTLRSTMEVVNGTGGGCSRC
ncbi:hypothetical protein B0T20DRAFT_495979 [Sordaria brevicollis]|uniref:Uncharacterized protein n=1 Tax=Sordaria brevicollis TaxID=83679 RepID=A0AAE0PH91_SORBR|nr:hypothetical protein B0T20DRAFT_495979 [Sordaria brevicollis]